MASDKQIVGLMPIWKSGSRFSIYLLFVLCLLTFGTWILYYNFKRVGDQEFWVKHTYEAVEQLSLLESSLKESEVDARKAASTHSPQLQSEMEASFQEVDRHLRGILSLTDDNLVQQELSQSLRQLLEERRAGLRALSLGKTNVNLLDETHYQEFLRTIAEMKDVETDLLELRAVTARESRVTFIVVLLFTGLLNCLIAGVAFRQAEMTNRRTEDERREQERRSKESADLAEASSLMTGESSAQKCAEAISWFMKERFGLSAIKVYLKSGGQVEELVNHGGSAEGKSYLSEGLVIEAFKKT
jgi:CHASE3 domain sensor protein